MNQFFFLIHFCNIDFWLVVPLISAEYEFSFIVIPPHSFLLIGSKSVKCWRDFHNVFINICTLKAIGLYYVMISIRQSASGRNKCMHSRSCILCYNRKQLCVIRNSFASYGGNVIFACCTNKAEGQLTEDRIKMRILIMNRKSIQCKKQYIYKDMIYNSKACTMPWFQNHSSR